MIQVACDDSIFSATPQHYLSLISRAILISELVSSKS